MKFLQALSVLLFGFSTLELPTSTSLSNSEVTFFDRRPKESKLMFERSSTGGVKAPGSALFFDGFSGGQVYLFRKFLRGLFLEELNQ